MGTMLIFIYILFEDEGKSFTIYHQKDPDLGLLHCTAKARKMSEWLSLHFLYTGQITAASECDWSLLLRGLCPCIHHLGSWATSLFFSVHLLTERLWTPPMSAHGKLHTFKIEMNV